MAAPPSRRLGLFLLGALLACSSPEGRYLELEVILTREIHPQQVQRLELTMASASDEPLVLEAVEGVQRGELDDGTPYEILCLPHEYQATLSPSSGGILFDEAFTRPLSLEFTGDTPPLLLRVTGYDGEGDAVVAGEGLCHEDEEPCIRGEGAQRLTILLEPIDCPECLCPGGEDPEVSCDDGEDNDCNDLIDCLDPSCALWAPCVESCLDGVDNDGDLLADCLDSDCEGRSCDAIGGICLGGACTAACESTVETLCYDGVDNDCDGLMDCLDPDCSMEPLCVENCRDNKDNDGDNLADCLDPDCAGQSCNSLGGLCLQGVCSMACDPPETLCQDGLDNDCDNLRDCDDPDCAGLALCMEDCQDRVDNDGDGLMDCLDPDCEGRSCDGLAGFCQGGACHLACDTDEFHCMDGNDNDCDLMTDCQDSDCWDNPLCSMDCESCQDPACEGQSCDDSDGVCRNGACGPPCPPIELDCQDGRDNDCDGDLDCGDEDCQGLPECSEICDDDVDNNEDGRVDCQETPACDLQPCDGQGRICFGGVCTCLLSEHISIACSDPVGDTCENGLDDDQDGRIDCADPECMANDAGCRVVPSNLGHDLLCQRPGDLFFSSNATIDTDSGTISPGFEGVVGEVVPQNVAGSLDVRLFSYDRIIIGPGVVVTVQGSRPLVLMACGSMVINGSLDVSAQGQQAGPGGGYGGLDGQAGVGCGFGVGGQSVEPWSDSGAGGGGLGGGGGAGGRCNDVGCSAPGGGSCAVREMLIPLGGGSGGGGGSSGGDNHGGVGGGGGGAVQLTAIRSILVGGRIHAGGGGGDGGRARINMGAGGGGGSGGAILLEAAEVTIQGTLAANGGGRRRRGLRPVGLECQGWRFGPGGDGEPGQGCWGGGVSRLVQ